MLLQGKKIGFALTIKQLSNTVILQEIEKLMLSGAELFIILLDPPEKKEALKNKLQNILRQIRQELTKKRGEINNSITVTENLNAGLNYPFLDLLVVIPDSERFLNFLEQATPEGDTGLPLVLVPTLKNEPAPSLGYISSLMKKKNIYFVPFGPVGQKPKKEEKNTYLCSRLDLLMETCSAALEGHQLKPSTWEGHFFPH
ncbi:MAG: hypothetical protein GX996_11015 [Firmicutes bacterium]|nr:hypothetical protein [Bacillota bacterium]